MVWFVLKLRSYWLWGYDHIRSKDTWSIYQSVCHFDTHSVVLVAVGIALLIVTGRGIGAGIGDVPRIRLVVTVRTILSPYKGIETGEVVLWNMVTYMSGFFWHFYGSRCSWSLPVCWVLKLESLSFFSKSSSFFPGPLSLFKNPEVLKIWSYFFFEKMAVFWWKIR